MNEQELIQLMNEAERRGDMDTAKRALMQLEKLKVQTQPVKPVRQPPTIPQQSANQDPGKTADTVRNMYAQGMDTFMKRTLDPTLSLLSGMVAQPVAGMAGLAQTMNPFAPEGQGAQTVRDVQNMLTYQPGPEGQQTLATMVEQLQPVTDAIDMLRTGDSTYQATGSPLLSTINQIAPEIAMSVLPLKGMQKPPPLPRPNVPNMQPQPRPQRMELPKVQFDKGGNLQSGLGTKGDIKSHIINKTGDVSTSDFKIGPRGNVIKDPAALVAMKNGVNKPIVSIIKAGTQAEKNNYKEMFNIVRRHLKNPGATDARPSDPVGRSLLNRINHVNRIKVAEGALIDDVAKTTLGGKPVYIDPAFQRFYDEILRLGGKVDGDKLKFDIDSQLFNQNKVVKVLNAAHQKIINTPNDGYAAHRLKQWIDSQVNYEKARQTGLSGQPERILKDMRASINESLKGMSPEYDKVNTTFSETTKAINDFQKAAGTIDIFSDSADTAVGVRLRNLLGNRVTRGNLRDSIAQLDRTANKYGGNFDDQMARQMMVVDEMERLFQDILPIKTSFKGDIKQAGQTMAETMSARQTGIEMVRGMMKKEFDQAKTLQSLQELLNSLEQNNAKFNHQKQ